MERDERLEQPLVRAPQAGHRGRLVGQDAYDLSAGRAIDRWMVLNLDPGDVVAPCGREDQVPVGAPDPNDRGLIVREDAGLDAYEELPVVLTSHVLDHELGGHACDHDVEGHVFGPALGLLLGFRERAFRKREGRAEHAEQEQGSGAPCDPTLPTHVSPIHWTRRQATARRAGAYLFSFGGPAGKLEPDMRARIQGIDM